MQAGKPTPVASGRQEALTGEGDGEGLGLGEGLGDCSMHAIVSIQ